MRRYSTNGLYNIILPERQKILNDNLIKLCDRWNIGSDDLLPETAPNQLAPYPYFSTHNVNKDYVSYPRLAVTRLLTKRWCEAREYYTIYLDSPSTKSAAMTLGNLHHLRLEHQIHKVVDTTCLKEYLATIDDKSALVSGYNKEAKIMKSWVDQIITRLYSLFTTGTAREVAVHAWLDFDKCRLGGPGDNKVSVNGVIDQLVLENHTDPKDLSMVEDILTHIDVCGQGIFQLLKGFDTASEGHHDTKIVVSDIKTRPFSKAPTQHSVTDAAMIQTMYYHRIIEILAEDPTASRDSFLANASRRGVDVNSPLNYTELVLLIARTDVFDEDLLTCVGVGGSEYNPSQWLTPEIVANIDDIQNIGHRLQPFLTEWENPPTLKYFADRAARMFHLCHRRLANTTTVEYHNVKTKRRFETQVFSIDEHKLDLEITDAVTFWSGQRPPSYADDIKMCAGCTFEEKCRRPKSQTPADLAKENIGREIYNYLDNVAHQQKKPPTEI